MGPHLLFCSPYKPSNLLVTYKHKEAARARKGRSPRPILSHRRAARLCPTSSAFLRGKFLRGRFLRVRGPRARKGQTPRPVLAHRRAVRLCPTTSAFLRGRCIPARALHFCAGDATRAGAARREPTPREA